MSFPHDTLPENWNPAEDMVLPSMDKMASLIFIPSKASEKRLAVEFSHLKKRKHQKSVSEKKFMERKKRGWMKPISHGLLKENLDG
jgi:hypothetical protein